MRRPIALSSTVASQGQASNCPDRHHQRPGLTTVSRTEHHHPNHPLDERPTPGQPAVTTLPTPTTQLLDSTNARSYHLRELRSALSGTRFGGLLRALTASPHPSK